jgi:archaellum biogenesis protein FlaJ (TadC family)
MGIPTEILTPVPLSLILVFAITATFAIVVADGNDDRNAYDLGLLHLLSASYLIISSSVAVEAAIPVFYYEYNRCY